MKIEDELRKMIIERYGSVIDFANSVNIPNSTLSNMLKNGIGRTSITNIFKICDALGISADALAVEKIIPVDKSKKVEHIEDLAKDMKLKFENHTITLSGIPLNDDERETILDALEIGIGIIKRKREK